VPVATATPAYVARIVSAKKTQLAVRRAAKKARCIRTIGRNVQIFRDKGRGNQELQAGAV
jgi:hypothetical protein